MRPTSFTTPAWWSIEAQSRMFLGLVGMDTERFCSTIKEAVIMKTGALLGMSGLIAASFLSSVRRNKTLQAAEGTAAASGEKTEVSSSA